MRPATLLPTVVCALVAGGCQHWCPPPLPVDTAPNAFIDFDRSGVDPGRSIRPGAGVDGTAAMELGPFSGRQLLWLSPAVFQGEPVRALRLSCQARLLRGNGRLGATVVAWQADCRRPIFFRSRQVRGGELPLGEWAELVLEVRMGDIPPGTADVFGLHLDNLANSTLLLDNMHFTAVTADVPGRPRSSASGTAAP